MGFMKDHFAGAYVRVFGFPPSDLGLINRFRFNRKVRALSHGALVDIGVRFGHSSALMLSGSRRRGLMVYGVDVDVSKCRKDVSQSARYRLVQADSATAALDLASRGPFSMVFIDGLHVEEIVLAEIRAWISLLAIPGILAFHDTAWAPGVRETIGGEAQGRPDEAVVKYFGLERLGPYESDELKVEHYKSVNGLTFVTVKRRFESPITEDEWARILAKRKWILSNFLTPTQMEDLGVSWTV